MAVLIAAAVKLRDDFDELAPNRDTASDGWIGDTTHQQEVSDHNPDETGAVPIHDADKVNEVHAIDVDDDLRYPNLTMEMVIQFLLARCRSGAENRFRYIIYNRRIWEAKNDWVQRAYTGPSPHTEHAHFSFSYTTSLEASTVSYRLELIPVAMTQADKDWFTQEIAERITAALPAIASAVAPKVYVYNRSQIDPADSDTAKNLDYAVITQALASGLVVKPYANNQATVTEILKPINVTPAAKK